MSFSNSTQLAVDITLCIDKLSHFIEQKSSKIAKNSRGIFISQESLNELVAILELFTELSNKVAKNEEQLGLQTMQNYHLKGRIEHMTQVLQLCYNDYKHNKRNDAITYLNIALSNT
mgnify:CR=1 FL=1